MAEPATVTFDGTTYELDKLTQEARTHINNVRACDQRLQQLQHDQAITQTARGVYLEALKRALPTEAEAGDETHTVTAADDVPVVGSGDSETGDSETGDSETGGAEH